MILKNPTNQILTIVFKGKTLSVEPLSTVEVTEVEGAHWMKIHAFLSPEVKTPVKEAKVEKEVEVEEEVIEKPKKK